MACQDSQLGETNHGRREKENEEHATYTKWEGISNLQSNGMLSELCSGSGDCDFVYWEILKCCLTRVRNLGISGACLTLGGS